MRWYRWLPAGAVIALNLVIYEPLALGQTVVKQSKPQSKQKEFEVKNELNVEKASDVK